MRLPVPHFQQEHSYTCLPACVRMILAYHDKNYSEAELAHKFNTVRLLGATPEQAVTGLKAMGFQALWFENASLERLIELLTHSWPVIIFLRAADLPHGRRGFHSMVVIGIENNQIICLAPSLKSDFYFELSNFSQVWSKLDNQGLVLWP